MKKLILIGIAYLAVLSTISLVPSKAPAQSSGWSWGLGYNNPAGATVGLNFMHLWTDWAFEIGVGYIGSNESWNDGKDKETTTVTVAGDLDIKYLFGSSDFRPYLQGGVSAGISTSDSGEVGAGASISRPFGGAGVFVMGSSAYMYASYIFLNGDTFQVGLGFPF